MFTRIGLIAAKLVADPAKLQAAANEAPRMKGGSEPSTRGRERPDPLPRLNAEESASNVNGKDRGTMKAPVSDARGNVRQTTASLEVVASVASLPNMSRSMATVYSTAPHRESFARSAVVIDLLVWKERHSTASGAC